MTRVANFTKTSDEGFIGALNEELKEVRRKAERQVERTQRIEGVVITTTASVGNREVKHSLGVVPKLVVLEVMETGTAVFYKPHTAESVFVRVFSGSPVTLNVVVRG